MVNQSISVTELKVFRFYVLIQMTLISGHRERRMVNRFRHNDKSEFIEPVLRFFFFQ